MSAMLLIRRIVRIRWEGNWLPSTICLLVCYNLSLACSLSLSLSLLSTYLSMYPNLGHAFGKQAHLREVCLLVLFELLPKDDLTCFREPMNCQSRFSICEKSHKGPGSIESRANTTPHKEIGHITSLHTTPTLSTLDHQPLQALSPTRIT